MSSLTQDIKVGIGEVHSLLQQHHAYRYGCWPALLCAGNRSSLAYCRFESSRNEADFSAETMAHATTSATSANPIANPRFSAGRPRPGIFMERSSRLGHWCNCDARRGDASNLMGVEAATRLDGAGLRQHRPSGSRALRTPNVNPLFSIENRGCAVENKEQRTDGCALLSTERAIHYPQTPTTETTQWHIQTTATKPLTSRERVRAQ